MDFFNLLDKVTYPGFDDNYVSYVLSTSIGNRVILKQSLLKDLTTYEYYVEDGQRPDQIAHLYYDDYRLTWLIFLANDIIDPYYDWPLSSIQLQNYIADKYGSIQDAENGIHHYEEIVFPEEYRDNTYFKEVTQEVSLTRYRELPESKRKIISYLDYEYLLNDEKKNIVLIEDIYVPKILQDAKRIFG